MHYLNSGIHSANERTTEQTENNTATYSIKEARAFPLFYSVSFSVEGVGNGRALYYIIQAFSGCVQ
jgi:hypothetical protein